MIHTITRFAETKNPSLFHTLRQPFTHDSIHPTLFFSFISTRGRTHKRQKRQKSCTHTMREFVQSSPAITSSHLRPRRRRQRFPEPKPRTINQQLTVCSRRTETAWKIRCTHAASTQKAMRKPWLETQDQLHQRQWRTPPQHAAGTLR